MMLARALLLRLAYQHHVRLKVPANHSQLLAVERIVKVADVLRLEIGELFSRRAIQMLQPQIIGLALAHRINHARSVARELDRPRFDVQGVLGPRTFEVDEPRRLTGVDRQQQQLLLRVADAIRNESRQFSIGRKCDAAENRASGNRLRSPAVRWNSFQLVVRIGIEHRLAVGGAGGKVVKLPAGEFLRVPAIRIRPPDMTLDLARRARHEQDVSIRAGMREIRKRELGKHRRLHARGGTTSYDADAQFQTKTLTFPSCALVPLVVSGLSPGAAQTCPSTQPNQTLVTCWSPGNQYNLYIPHILSILRRSAEQRHKPGGSRISLLRYARISNRN